MTADRALLQPAVDTARAVFGAAASSAIVVGEDGGVLVFAAVAGAIAGSLVGRHMPAETGVAGWVLRSGESLRLDDLAGGDIFGGAAECGGYLPRTLMAAPLLCNDCCVGVLEVLDWTEGSRGELADLGLLGLIAEQAAAAWTLTHRTSVLDRHPDPKVVELRARIGHALSGVSGAELDRRIAVFRSLADMLCG